MRLDQLGDSRRPARLDDVGVERPLDEKSSGAESPGLLLEDPNEFLADDLPLLLGVGHADEPGKEALTSVHVDERDVEVAPERLDDLSRLVLSQESVVDENAGELVADCLVDEKRCHRGVDTTRKGAKDALAADLGTDPLGLLLDHGRGRPYRRRIGDVVKEVLEDFGPVRGVYDLRVELDSVELSLRVLERGDRSG